jgi:hypothetical protein
MHEAPDKPVGEPEALPEEQLRGDSTAVAAQSRGQRSLLAPAVDLLVKLFTIAVPMCYVMGRMYISGYWGALHLPSSVASYEFHDYIFYGFIALFFPLIHFVLNDGDGRIVDAELAALGIVVLILIWLFLTRRLRPLLTMFGAWLDRKLLPLRKSESVQSVASAVLVGCVILLVLLLAILGVIFAVYPMSAALTSGKADGNAKRLELQEHPDKFGTALWTTSDGSRVAGLLVDCSDSWCTTYHRGVIQVVPRSAISKIIGATPKDPIERDKKQVPGS